MIPRGAAAAGALPLVLEALDEEDLEDLEALIAEEALPVVRARVWQAMISDERCWDV